MDGVRGRGGSVWGRIARMTGGLGMRGLQRALGSCRVSEGKEAEDGSSSTRAGGGGAF